MFATGFWQFRLFLPFFVNPFAGYCKFAVVAVK
jgi:hypothetical protein